MFSPDNILEIRVCCLSRLTVLKCQHSKNFLVSGFTLFLCGAWNPSPLSGVKLTKAWPVMPPRSFIGFPRISFGPILQHIIHPEAQIRPNLVKFQDLVIWAILAVKEFTEGNPKINKSISLLRLCSGIISSPPELIGGVCGSKPCPGTPIYRISISC